MVIVAPGHTHMFGKTPLDERSAHCRGL